MNLDRSFSSFVAFLCTLAHVTGEMGTHTFLLLPNFAAKMCASPFPISHFRWVRQRTDWLHTRKIIVTSTQKVNN